MNALRTIRLVLAVAAGLALANSASAEGPGASSGPGKVVARVDGHDITAREVELAADDILPQLQDVPANLRFPFVVEYLVERHLLAKAAEQEGIEESSEFRERLAFYKAKALRDAYFAAKLRPGVTEDMIRKAYDEQAGRIKPEERVRAKHILVATEQDANEVVARLNKGEKFEDLATQLSLDGSKEYGGDLGYFTAAEMVPEFSKATFALKVGEVSGPVKTDYGWHVIKLEDRRASGAQPYDQVKNAIRMVLLRKQVQDRVVELRRTAKIEILDPDLKRLQEESEKKRQEIQQQLQSRKGGAAGGSSGEGTEAPPSQEPQPQEDAGAPSGKGDKAN